ncbi:MAG: phage integrase N-terminal SAM-like domain-containing protein [Verrucomicrobiales bacterium]|nr:phage integrase N-terminal SAM-like domain-containing protein [Verrucomicrobiales bacterium]
MSKLRQQLIEELVLRGCAERTQEAYVQQVRQLAGHFGQAPDRLSEGQVREYLLHLARERQLAASTINQAVCAIRFFYERVLHREVSVLRQALPFTRKPVLRPQVYATGELEKLFTVGCPHPKHRAFLMTVYGAGLRLNEACHLKAEHLDAARQQIRIVQGKGRKDRYTLLSPRLLEELRAYWRMFRPQHWLFPATRTPERPMVDATGQRIYYQAVQRAGLRGSPPISWTGRAQSAKKDRLTCPKPDLPTPKSSASRRSNCSWTAVAPWTGWPPNWASPPTPSVPGGTVPWAGGVERRPLRRSRRAGAQRPRPTPPSRSASSTARSNTSAASATS